MPNPNQTPTDPAAPEPAVKNKNKKNKAKNAPRYPDYPPPPWWNGYQPGYWGYPPQGMPPPPYCHGCQTQAPPPQGPAQAAPPEANHDFIHDFMKNPLSSVSSLLGMNDPEFWKGVVLGAAAMILFTNRSHQDEP
ncbi:MAG: hypothetical protein HQM03_03220 [Magnetococcales bacterium]|nr:hypothetical protein [Magnetococcales bacterium]